MKGNFEHKSRLDNVLNRRSGHRVVKVEVMRVQLAEVNVHFLDVIRHDRCPFRSGCYAQLYVGVSQM